MSGFLVGMGMAHGAEVTAAETQAAKMPPVIEQYSANRMSLLRTYTVRISPVRMARMEKFYEGELAQLSEMNFDSLSHEDQVDYLLLKMQCNGQLHELALKKKQIAEMKPLLPFAPAIEELMNQKRLMQRPDAEKSAGMLAAMVKQIAAAEKELDPERHGPGDEKPARKFDRMAAHRAVLATEALQRNLSDWYGEYSGYDPAFTWWVEMPYKSADKALTGYAAFLKEKVIGIKADDKTTIIGDPVGRDALMADLADNMLPYTPEELIAIAQTEYDWCLKQMIEASREMGYGDNWHAAVEKVKEMHVAPGEQPEAIRKLVLEGIDFAKTNNLVTIPPMAEETWRMMMMTPQRQLVNPFFTGGNEISVSYPTNTMTYDQREMSMRGNSIPLSHATAFHEMIPGHFLQFYMMARHRPYRRVFMTPFWVEGNAFWWEMLYYQKGFDATPAERVGALMWRMHRSARVIFTMNFHLGKWTPQQCVKYLMDNVGWDVDNATAEVRRSFNGSVGPLYQCAYLMGALQFRALHKELVGSGKMTEKQFADAVLHEGPMPIELLRTDLEDLPLTPDYKSQWKYYGEHPTHP
ncbi:MAG TPA: DUF885 family protein [Terracidiphilus sp.]|nr:DUF885 family protein [Terracidiphilus sp.]